MKFIPPFRDSIKIFVIGVLMGSADAVPGISGGTVALIAGIYGRLITAVTAITPRRIITLFCTVLPAGGGTSRERAIETLDQLDVVFVATLVVGIATAVVIVGRIIEYAVGRAPVLLFGVFFGLIAGSALILWRGLTINTIGQWGAAVVGFCLAFVLSGGVEVLDTGGYVVIFIAGSIAVSAMILPGISGSLLLVILGQYIPMYGSLNAFLDGIIGLFTGGEIEAVIDPGRDVFVFLVGGLVGLFTIARVIRRLLNRHRRGTLAFLVALVIGALRAPISELSSMEGVTWTPTTIGEFIGFALVGMLIVMILDWYALNIDLEEL